MPKVHIGFFKHGRKFVMAFQAQYVKNVMFNKAKPRHMDYLTAYALELGIMFDAQNLIAETGGGYMSLWKLLRIIMITI
uniref:Uncharacterized protein n=1 Tax=Angiostrongylus cantonensis TaxID=6313 RepID=A0A0K0D8W9_ANGCA